jgi:outer membrane protein TolC
VKKAIQNDELVRIYQLDRNITTIQSSQILRSYLPSLDIDARYFHQSEIAKLDIPFIPGTTIDAGVYNQYDVSVEIKQLLFDGLNRFYTQRQLKTIFEEKSYRLQYRKRELEFLVYQLAYQYELQSTLLQSLHTSLQRLHLQKKKIQALYQQGFASRLDTLEIRNRISEIHLQMIRVQNERKQILTELQKICDVSSIDSVDVNIPDILTYDKIHQFLQHLLSDNFDLRILRFQKTTFRWKLRQDIQLFLPKVYLSFSYHRGKPGVDFFNNRWMNYWTVGVQFTWNLFRWGMDKQTLQMDQYRLKQMQYKQIYLEKQVKTGFQKLEIRFNALQKEQQTYQEIAQQKKEKYELIKKQWEEGQKSTLDVLDAEQELTRAEFQKKAIAIQMKLVLLAMQKLSGFPELD